MANRIQGRIFLASCEFERRDTKKIARAIHTQVLVRLSLHCSCRTCANAVATLPMASAVSPIEARFGVEGDESVVNHRDKDCKDICKACDDSSKTMSREA